MSLYQPAHFKSQNPEHAARLMREHPFASLISVDDAGLPFVTHLPLHLEAEGDDLSAWTIWGHCAKPNPHWRYLAARPQALVTFMGPQDYMSPSFYPDLARVPTWNYLAVHAQVRATLIETPAEKDALLKRLIGDHEPAYKQQWIDLGEEYQHKMLAGIVGFALRIERLDCKIKINQHRSESHAKMHAHYAQGNDAQRGLARWMYEMGLVNAAA
jgi:transcriptional regulator